MAFVFRTLPGEAPLQHVPVPGPWSGFLRFRFGFLVTHQAAYLPVKRGGFHLQDDLQPLRIPIQDISQLTLSHAPFPTSTLWFDGILSVLFILAGITLHEAGTPWFASFWLLASVLPQFLFTLLGSAHRLRLTVHTAGDTLTYTPAPEVSWLPQSRRRTRHSQLSFAQACRHLGIHVDDSAATVPVPPRA